MNITQVLYDVFVIPEYLGKPNVIQRVRWGIVFEKEGISSEAGIETTLDITKIEEFISADEVGNARVLEWAYQAQGGEGFLQHILPHHEEQVDYAILCSKQVSYTNGFDITPIKTLNASPQTLPATIL